MSKIIVGYRTRPVDDLEVLIPPFTANRVLTEESRIKADLAGKRAAFLAEAANMPYTGTFDEVYLIAGRSREALSIRHSKERTPGGRLPPVSVAVANWIREHFPDAWRGEDEPGKPQIR